MERLGLIFFAAAIGTGFYYWFASMIERQSMQDYIRSHFWLLHPNSICYWRTAMALVGYVLYFHTSYQRRRSSSSPSPRSRPGRRGGGAGE